jgi:hypothetical protein
MFKPNPIVTLGLDSLISMVVTQGYGPAGVIVEITVLPAVPGGRSGKRRKDEEERLIRIRVIDEDGKTMIQERLIPLEELNKITIRVNETGSFIKGSDIYLKVKEGEIREGETKQIRKDAHETKQRKIPDR